jgi:CubicO group peptidase (beta-lactamase class C family)
MCSVTKSFTATGLALLVDEGKLEWDAPVREMLPEFRLRDPVASEQATLRDLLTHRTGLPRHDWAISTMPACSPRCAISNPASRSAAPINTRT